MNALTNCCHFPYFADGICPNCNKECSPLPILEPEWMEDKSRTYYADAVQEPISPLPEFKERIKVLRFPNDEELYDDFAQTISNEMI